MEGPIAESIQAERARQALFVAQPSHPCGVRLRRALEMRRRLGPTRSARIHIAPRPG